MFYTYLHYVYGYLGHFYQEVPALSVSNSMSLQRLCCVLKNAAYCEGIGNALFLNNAFYAFYLLR